MLSYRQQERKRTCKDISPEPEKAGSQREFTMNKEQENSTAVESTAKKIELTVKECVNKEKGNKFLAYKVTTKDGHFMDCKFRKEVTAPTQNGFIWVKPEQMNVTSNTKYPVLWVKQIEKFVSKDEIADGYISEKDFKKINDLF